MKHSLLFAFLLATVLGYTQSYSNLEFNNVNVTLSDVGNFFENGATSTPGYEVPAGSGIHALYSMGFWMQGSDMWLSNNSSYTKYSSDRELTGGPISDDYTSAYYLDNFGTSIWTISQAEIDLHVDNYFTAGYVVPEAIANWPGNGNSAEGVADVLAPYVDANSNGTYDPENGDRPFIRGDKATFVILNDENAPDIVWGAPFGVELHVMMYQFATDDALDNTTFFNVKVYNRRETDYVDFKFGIFADFDLGNYQDDYWGSDSARKYMFVYNADNNDENGGGVMGYGANPPAVGIVSLSHSLESALMYSTSSGGPMTYNEHYFAMHGFQGDGTPHLHPDGYETKFMYSDNPGLPFSEAGASNVPEDRRGLMTIEANYLAAGESQCMDFAVVYHRDITGDNIQNALQLDTVVDFVQNYFDTNIQDCNTIVVGQEEMAVASFEVFPNPSNGEFTVTVDEASDIQIFTGSGKLVYTGLLLPGDNQIDVDLVSGLYLLSIRTENATAVKKIHIK